MFLVAIAGSMFGSFSAVPFDLAGGLLWVLMIRNKQEDQCIASESDDTSTLARSAICSSALWSFATPSCAGATSCSSTLSANSSSVSVASEKRWISRGLYLVVTAVAVMFSKRLSATSRVGVKIAKGWLMEVCLASRITTKD